jgi:glycosyltransferase involved in cell wall biosynthesis
MNTIRINFTVHLATCRQRCQEETICNLQIPAVLEYMFKEITQHMSFTEIVNEKKLHGRKITFSIVTATFNSEKTLLSCLMSINYQTYPHKQHIIIDGQSLDRTLEIINAHKNQIDIVISEQDRGIYDALNKGIALCTGDVIGFLHSDDTYASYETLSIIAKVFEDETICAVYGDLAYVSNKNPNNIFRLWKSKSFKAFDLKLGWMPPHPTLYVKKEWFQKIGNFDINYKISADYHLIVRLFGSKDFKSVYLPKKLINMRVGGASNRSISAVIIKMKEDWRALREYGFNLPQTLLALSCKNLRKFNQFLIK